MLRAELLGAQRFVDALLVDLAIGPYRSQFLAELGWHGGHSPSDTTRPGTAWSAGLFGMVPLASAESGPADGRGRSGDGCHLRGRSAPAVAAAGRSAGPSRAVVPFAGADALGEAVATAAW